jgi:site-specific recombinase XerD
MRKSVKIAIPKGKPVFSAPTVTDISGAVPYLSKEEVERFFAVIPAGNSRDLLLFDLIYRYGLRRQEAALLQTNYLREGRIWIARVKGGRSGEYPVHPTTRRRLWAYLNRRQPSESDFLFTSRQSGSRPISASGIYLHFRQYAEDADLPPDRRHVHVLRHSIAVHLMNAGWDLADVQDWLGHRDISSTTVYASVTNKRREKNYLRVISSPEIART